MMLIMSTEELEKYKKLYSELVGQLADLHNTHLIFINELGRHSGFKARRHLKSIATIALTMKKLGPRVYTEALANKRLKRIHLREEKNNKKKK